MQTKSKRNCKVVTALATLMLVLTLLLACESVKLVKSPAPKINFPTFPDASSAVYDNATDTVTMSLDLWLKIVEYAVDVDAIDKTLDDWRKIDEGEQ